MNKEQKSTISVDVLAKRCDEPYLTVSVGNKNSKNFIECALSSKTTKADLKICKFTCNCNCTCKCLITTVQTIGQESQTLCEIHTY